MSAIVTLEREAPDAEALADFNRRLEQLAPRGGFRTYFHAYWEPGEWWCPVERYVIGEAYPRPLIEEEHRFYLAAGVHPTETRLAELEGPSPREGAWYGVAKPGEKARLHFRIDRKDEQGRDEELIPTFTQRQWLLWRSERALIVPVWIVQGPKGGHERQFSQFQETLRRMKKLEPRAPYPGQLEYAPLDNRVFDALIRSRELHRTMAGLRDDWHDRMMRYEESDGREGNPTEAEQAVWKAYSAWMDDSIDNRR